MQCQHVKKKLERYLDNELPEMERTTVEEHLSKCAVCAEELRALKSIHGAGEMKFVPDPPPQYWGQLLQKINNRIAELEEKPTRWALILNKIQDIIWPAKISYRLVSITATAVVLFLVIRISFLENNKFETPLGPLGKESIKLPDKAEESLEMENAPRPSEDVTQMKKTPKETHYAANKMAKSREREESQSLKQLEGKGGRGTESKEIAGIADISDEESQPVKDEMTSLAEQEKQHRTQSFRQATAVKPGPETQIVKTSQRQLPRMPDLETGAITATPEQAEASDSALVYHSFLMQVENTDDIAEKIDIWETYLRSNPERSFVKRARYEQSQLYFKLAKEKMTEEEINRALRFFSDNIELLQTDENRITIQNQIQELKTLLANIKK